MSDQKSLEISVSQSAGFANAADSIGENAKNAFDSLGSLLTEAIEPFRKKLTESMSSADEIELKLDLALKGGGKWVVVSMEGTATVSVKLLWKRQP